MSAALIAVALALLFMGIVWLFGEPDEGGRGRASAPLAAPAQPISNDSQPETPEDEDLRAPLSARSAPPDAGDARRVDSARVDQERQLVAGDQREVVELDELAGSEDPLPRAPVPVRQAPSPAAAPLVARDAGGAGAADNVEPPLEPPARRVRDAAPPPEAPPVAPDPSEDVALEPCGANVCPSGMVCCNESCSICTLPGQSCSKLTCSMPALPFSVPCGRNTCSIGEVCCNLSCGICAAPGAECSQRVCD